MVDIEKIDNQLYVARYGVANGAAKGVATEADTNALWRQIKSNQEVLREAVKVKRNRWDSGDTVKGLAIADAMLVDYQDVDQVAYNELIKSIYTNTDIARTVVDGAANGGYSFLLMSLWNHNLKLTDEQKAFAVSEAMNKTGTTKYKKQREEYSRRLDEQGITDDILSTIDIDGSCNPIGAKTKSEYFNQMFITMSDTQAHGIGAFDIRYHILRNPNWSLEEKRQLIMDFWYDDEAYDETLEQWEWGVISDAASCCEGKEVSLDKCELLNDLTYEMVASVCDKKEVADWLWAEIEFCRQMHQLRPQQWEVEVAPQKVLTSEKTKAGN